MCVEQFHVFPAGNRPNRFDHWIRVRRVADPAKKILAQNAIDEARSPDPLNFHDLNLTRWML